MAGYSGTPLVEKLGVKGGTRLMLLGAPAGFRRELVGLPDGVQVLERASGTADLVVWFPRSRRELEAESPRIRGCMTAGLWIGWPKKSSGVKTDLTEDLVRRAGLANGLVDYKVCAINDVWSGLKFAARKTARKG